MSGGTTLAAASPRAGVAFGMAAALAWALYVVGSRFGLSQGFDAWDLTAMRYTVAGLVFLPVVLRAPGSLAGVGWGRGAVLALCAGPLFALLLAAGFAMTPLAHGATINPAVITLASLGLGAAFLGDRLGASALAGIAFVLVGLVLVAALGGGGPAPGGGASSRFGDLLFVGSGLLWALYTLNLRRWSVPPLAATAAVSVLSLAVVLPAFLLLRGPGHLLANPGAAALQAFVQGGLSGVGGTLAYSLAVRHLGASRAGLFPSLVPALAVLLGIPLLGEWPTPVQAVGVVVATVGLALAVRTPTPRGRDDRPTAHGGVRHAGLGVGGAFVLGAGSELHP